MSAAIEFRAILNKNIESIKRQMVNRAYRSAQALRRASMDVLRGQRSGRRYLVPGTYSKDKLKKNRKTGRMRGGRYYTASAPGSPPAVRTGTFRNSWQPSAICDGVTFISRIESNVDVNGHSLGNILEYGTSRMAARPHHEKIKEKALPEIQRIYSEPYF